MYYTWVEHGLLLDAFVTFERITLMDLLQLVRIRSLVVNGSHKVQLPVKRSPSRYITCMPISLSLKILNPENPENLEFV